MTTSETEQIKAFCQRYRVWSICRRVAEEGAQPVKAQSVCREVAKEATQPAADR